MVGRDAHVIGTRIARRRHQLGWTQIELAARLGVSPSTVANWERGASYPKKKLGKVEQVLGVRLDEDENGTPGEPEIPQTMMDSVDRMLPEGDPYREAVLDLLRQAVKQQAATGNTGPMAAVPPADERGRHRRRAG